MHRFENISTIAFYTFRRTILPLEDVDWNNFAAEFYHMKVQHPTTKEGVRVN